MRFLIEVTYNNIVGVEIWEVHDTETGDVEYCQTKQEAEEYIDAQENFFA